MSIVPAHHLQLSDAQHALLLGLMAQHVPHLQVWAFGSRVKGTARASSDLDVVFFATEADHALDQALLLEGQRERRAHEAAADQAELLECHAPTFKGVASCNTWYWA